jgi:hypothetical protein
MYLKLECVDRTQVCDGQVSLVVEFVLGGVTHLIASTLSNNLTVTESIPAPNPAIKLPQASNLF